MYIPKTTGHIIYKPLLTSFDVLENGGSAQQKYDATEGEYSPDLSVTPYVLTPYLYIEDPNGNIDDGDYSSSLVNCIWTVEGHHNGEDLKSGTDYTIDSVTHALSLLTNLDAGTTGKISFTAQYVDSARGEVLKFEWSVDLSCISTTSWRMWMKVDMPKKMSLSPFKTYGSFDVSVQLMNGKNEVADTDATYKWQVLENGAWRDIDDFDIWCGSGTGSKTITVNQDYINRTVILVTAYANDNSDEKCTQAFIIRRFYGQYSEDIYITEGKYINGDTARAVAKVKVTNKNGNISDPCNYFDIEILFNKGYTDTGWQHVAYGTEGIVTRADMGPDDTSNKTYGAVVRELTANIPICTDDDTALMIDEDTVLVGQFPTIDREV
ncbi:MAG: hypothetical protein LUC88_00280 [Prevotella sp.]|nr:hypothetical protein [Prevotella sp.]